MIDLENEALDRFFNGDMSGYRDLWSKKSFTYFDANTVKRVDSLDQMDAFLNNLEGFMHADYYRFEEPRVQFSDDHTMGILTYQLFADTNIANICYNVVEVFQKEDDGWHVLHSTWSFIKPMNIDWAPIKHRMVMVEPMLEKVNLSQWLSPDLIEGVSVGGESGKYARSLDYDWVLDIHRQCADAGVLFHFHQTGSYLIKNGRQYSIPRQHQHTQAHKANLDS